MEAAKPTRPGIASEGLQLRAIEGSFAPSQLIHLHSQVIFRKICAPHFIAGIPMKASIALLAAGVLAGCAAQGPVPAAGETNPGAIFILRQTSKTPDQVVDAVKAYAEANKWVYMGMNRVKPPQGEVTMVKVCIPAVGAIMWPLGLQTSAMLPCGNLGVYQKGGATEISLLDPRYMSILMPHPEVNRASAMATTLLTQMLDSVAK